MEPAIETLHEHARAFDEVLNITYIILQLKYYKYNNSTTVENLSTCAGNDT